MPKRSKSRCSNLSSAAALSALLVLVSVSAGSQTDRRMPPAVERLPPWRGEKAAAETPGTHVYRDVSTGEIVVSYPKGLETGERVSPEHRTTFRFHLSNRVDPEISVDVSRTPEGLYRYIYSVVNRPSSETAILTWALASPGHDTKLSMSHRTWKPSGPPRTVATPSGLIDIPTSSFLRWHGWTTPLNPGQQEVDFQLISSYKPGFTTAFLDGPGGVYSPSDMPESVSDQLVVLQRPDVMSRTASIIGPRFAPEESRVTIASRFKADVERLCERGTLDPKSGYVKNLLACLAEIVSPGVAACDFRDKPTSALEKAAARAFELSLSTDK